MRKVTMVVLVLITNCQVSLKPKSGPVTARTMMVANAGINAAGSLAPAHFICYDDGNARKINFDVTAGDRRIITEC